MQIVILDGYTANPGDISWAPLEELGELTVYDRTEECQTVSRIGKAEIVFTNKTVLDKNVFDECPRIKFIGVLATGYNVVDIEYAAKKGITVCNVPAYSTEATAQFAIAMLLEICHNVALHSALVHDGEWQRRGNFCFWDRPLIELSQKTMGIIGLGNIGKRTAAIAQALGMSVVAVTKSSRDVRETDTFRYVSLDELLKNSDVVVLHCPLTEETREIINKDTLAKMKAGAILLNNGRGPLINEKDVADALRSGKLYSAAVDVAATEPIASDSPLMSAPNCFITPHISWAPKEARMRLIHASARNLKMFLDGTPINRVN